MKSKGILAGLVLVTLMSGAALAQSFDPWAGYEVRDIRQMRDEAANRRQRLQDLAKYAHERRTEAAQAPTPMTSVAAAMTSSPRPPERSAQSKPVPDADVISKPSLTSARPPARPVPVWTGPALTPDVSTLIATKVSGAPFSVSKVRIASMGREMYSRPVGDLVARVSVSGQRMILMDGGSVIADWPVSTGKPGYESSRGTFGVSFLSRNHKSKKYNMAPMPCAVFYNGGEAIHGTNALGMLGRKASHGCVRLETVNACKVFDLVQERGLGSLSVVVEP